MPPTVSNPSITSWIRLEPRSRSAEMDASLQARVYDPLWMLARQWQFGEFQGEDNGSPVVSRWRAEEAKVARYHAGAIAPDTTVNAPRYDSATMPLETLVEREPVRPQDGPGQPARLRLAAGAGQQFLRMLAQQPVAGDYRAAIISQFPFPALTDQQRATMDEDSRSFCDLMALRVPDARLLAAAFRPDSAGDVVVPPVLRVAPADLAEVEKAARLWLRWFETLFSEPADAAPAWQPDRMEYAFSVGTRFSDGECVLTAQEYTDGHLDWYSFDSNAGVSLGGASDDVTTDVVRTVVPAPASFRGMPSARFWEFEDAQVNFGSMDAGPTDLVRMLLVEFALAYGNDWFVIPVELEVGALYRNRSLVITDTFGVRELIKSNSDSGPLNSRWRMFQQSYTRRSGFTVPASNMFFLPPSVLKSLESQPIEDVVFLRDEMANVAWAIESLIESPSGQRLNRFAAYQEQQRQRDESAPAPPPLAPGTLRYRLSTEVPDYWIPLLPVRVGPGLRLRRGQVLRVDGMPAPVPSLGRILESGQALSLYEEEVPREGIHVTRSYQFTRWTDGSSHLWIGRHKGAGRGEGSSGLRFDSLEPQAQNAGQETASRGGGP